MSKRERETSQSDKKINKIKKTLPVDEAKAEIINEKLENLCLIRRTYTKILQTV